MEILAVIFALGVFISLLLPEKKSDPPSAGDTFAKGLKALVKDVYKDVTAEPKKKPAEPSPPTWLIIFLAVILGFLFTYVL